MVAKKKTNGKKTCEKTLTPQPDIDKMLAVDAEQEANQTAVAGGALISIKGNSFTYQGTDLGEEMEVVILDFINEHSYYDAPYVQDNPGAPACWALSKNKPIDMAPSKNSVKKQSENCAGCWANEFGSASTGVGKACRNSRKLALISVSDLSDLKNAEVVFLSVPPTSLKSFDRMSNSIHKIYKRPLYGLVSEIKFDETSDFEKLIFNAVKPIEDGKILTELRALKESTLSSLSTEPDPTGYKEPPAKNASSRKKRK